MKTYAVVADVAAVFVLITLLAYAKMLLEDGTHPWMRRYARDAATVFQYVRQMPLTVHIVIRVILNRQLRNY